MAKICTNCLSLYIKSFNSSNSDSYKTSNKNLVKNSQLNKVKVTYVYFVYKSKKHAKNTYLKRHIVDFCDEFLFRDRINVFQGVPNRAGDLFGSNNSCQAWSIKRRVFVLILT